MRQAMTNKLAESEKAAAEAKFARYLEEASEMITRVDEPTLRKMYMRNLEWNCHDRYDILRQTAQMQVWSRHLMALDAAKAAGV